ncbi:orotidine-5'-phosphate decarboxylase [Aciduricibacillus chroicocephali]|uniref:Orotidine 5'-phosphate decarboxylase n=1 Tax=Aciduricibacillus chroicocephali TaxID=3054939 RepID=A0ABY9KYF4_9BACI|nr:orotidine-5'-phosphate decarboxylase [Bacillaceae bacterium 44XB]
MDHHNMYLALDLPNWEEAGKFLDDNKLHGVPVKVGMEMFYREGISVIEKLKENNHPIFLDLKLHDIPTTVMRAMKNLARLDVDMVTIHALGGGEMIAGAKEGLIAGSRSGKETKLVAVTLLTSMDQNALNNEVGIQGEMTEQVIRLASVAKDNGADGVVCSVHEAKQVKDQCGPEFLTVTPGIRLVKSQQDDQKRVATPKFARENGSDIIVIGRSITQAENPVRAYQQALGGWHDGK